MKSTHRRRLLATCHRWTGFRPAVLLPCRPLAQGTGITETADGPWSSGAVEFFSSEADYRSEPRMSLPWG